nr:sensor histidine kinase [Dyella flava]
MLCEGWLCAVAAITGSTAAAHPPNSESDDSHRALQQRLDRPLIDFSDTLFTPQQGTPTDIDQIAQTPDGFLWLGCAEGLVRFDGVNFVRDFGTTLPNHAVSSMFVDKDGDLWVGFLYGGIVRLSHGKFEAFDAGLPPGHIIWSIVQDQRGVLWATSGFGIYRLTGHRWTEVGSNIGPSTHSVYGLAGTLNDGRLWVANNKRIWFQKPGTDQFEQGDKDTLWKSKLGFDYTKLPKESADEIEKIVASPSGVGLRAVTLDASGALWSAFKDPFTRFRWVTSPGGKKEYVMEPLPHANNAIYTPFADRAGNIWLGEVGGLERLRPNKVNVLAAPNDIIGVEMSPAPDGAIWVGSNQNYGVYQIKGDSRVAWPALGTGLSAINLDKAGNTWFLKATLDPAEDDIRVLSNGVIKRLSYPAGVAGSTTIGIVDDPLGGHLLVTSVGFFRLNGDTWTPGSGRSGLPSDMPNHVYEDANGRIWLMYAGNRLAVIDGAHAFTYTAADGLAVGNVSSVDIKPDHFWVAGDDGVARWDGKRFVAITLAGNIPLRNATGVVETPQGDLWVNAVAGLYKISSAELDRAKANRDYHVNASMLDQDDGLQGGTQNLQHGQSLLQGSDGRLWAARSEGVAWIDPSRMMINPVAPQAIVLSISADGHDESMDALSLPALTHVLRIAYTAPSLSMPERVTFKYRLDGVDQDWQDAGTRREATYTNLRSGNYHFHVMAANEDGIWGQQDAVIRFHIAPAYYQTWWFMALCVIASALLASLLVAFRIHQLQARLRLQLTAKQDERERIARELHDTLMQAMYALVLQVQTWSDNRLIDIKLREDMRHVTDLTNKMLTDGRDRILALRDSSELESDLARMLRETGDELSRLFSSRFSIRKYGNSLGLRSDVLHNAFEIGRESIRNAFLHAEAGTVTVILRFDKRNLTLVVCDDGIGIPEDILATGGRDGHWGLAGMRERAQSIGGKLKIARGSHRGTEVTFTVPARHAYGTLTARLRRHLRWKLRPGGPS